MGRSPAKPAKRGQRKFTPGGLRVKHYFYRFSASRSFVNALRRNHVDCAKGEINRQSKAAVGVRELRCRVSHELDRACGERRPSRRAGLQIEQEIPQLVEGRIGTDPGMDVEASGGQH
jgi:hypothetical protein